MTGKISGVPLLHHSLGRRMLETLSTAAANFAAVEPTIQQAFALLLLSTALLGIGIGMAVGGLWMRYTNR